GPTEGTTFSCCYTVLATPTVKNSIPIGTPIANTQVYILDSRMRPVPIGVPGELYIGGDGLARGYWNDPALTAEKFVPDPASADAGARRYKTGDRVRYLADGNIEFLGRIDTQVKLRGYRVEPGEIEAVVKRNAGVQDCVVTVEDAGNDKRLIAYVVRNNNDPELDRIALRTYLHAKLPEYMVPSAFVFLDKLPLTANGKLDRKALPSAGEQAAEQSGEGPRGATEEMLAGIWSSLLGAANLQRENNFFDLGGHSLLTMQLAARLRQIFHCEVPLRAIFEFPVLQDMAAYLDASSSRPRTGKLVRIQPIPRESYLPVTRGQERIWFVSQLMGNSSVYNIAGAVRLKGEVDRERLERSFQEVVRRHEVLRSSFWVREKELEVRSGEDKEEAERRAVRGEAEQGFDLGQASQLRAGLLRVGERESVLVVVLHHMIADGWSIGVLLRELEQLYEAYGRGEESPLEELEIQYVDYAGWEEELLSSEEMKEGLEYWKKQLAGARGLELEGDYGRRGERSHRGGTIGFRLGKELSEKIREVARSAGVTLYMALLGCWQVLLWRYSGEKDVVVGSAVAQRPTVESEKLIGMMVNLVAMRTEVEERKSYRELLEQVKGTVMEGHRYEYVQFEKVVEEVEKRGGGGRELVQVVLAWQSGMKRELRLGEVVGRVEGVETGTAKFDVTITMGEGEGGEIEGSVEYSVDLFREETVRNLISHFRHVVEQVVQFPNQPLGELAFVTKDEEKQLAEWNQTKVDYPREKSIADLYSEVAARNPDAAAVVFGDRQLSYAELERRANQLSRHLSQQGIGPEAMVGICTERSLEMLVGILGILKAGAAYVPLDITYPAERLQFMAANAKIQVLLTQERLLPALPALNTTIVCLDRDWDEVSRQSQTPLQLRI